MCAILCFIHSHTAHRQPLSSHGGPHQWTHTAMPDEHEQPCGPAACRRTHSTEAGLHMQCSPIRTRILCSSRQAGWTCQPGPAKITLNNNNMVHACNASTCGDFKFEASLGYVANSVPKGTGYVAQESASLAQHKLGGAQL